MAALAICFGIDSTGYHDQAFSRAAREFDIEQMFARMQAVFATGQDNTDLDLERFIDAVDFKYLYAQSRELAMAVDFAADSLSRLPSPGDFDFQWTTPSGRIVLRGAADHAYPAGSYFLEDVYPLAYPDSAGLFISNTLWTRPGMIAGPPLATEKGVGHGCQWP